MTSVKTTVVPLAEPLDVGGQKVESVSVRQPQPGELRGVRLALLMALDVDALMAVLPRVTNPMLPEGALATMDAGAFLDLGIAVQGFFLGNGSRTI